MHWTRMTLQATPNKDLRNIMQIANIWPENMYATDEDDKLGGKVNVVQIPVQAW